MRGTILFSPVALAVLVLAVGPAAAVDFYVTTTVDTYDGICASHCSLRDAVVAANVNTSDDTIYLAAARYDLTISGAPEDFGQSGDLDIWSNIEIVGKGPKRTTIDANSTDRILDILANDVNVSIKGVTLTGGWLGSPSQGSALRIDSSNSNVTVETCILENNQSTAAATTRGGGIYFNGDAGAGSLVVRHTMIRNNSASYGAGIHTLGSNANVTVERSTIYNNTTFSGYGAIYNNDATVIIDNSTVSGNFATAGHAGIYNSLGNITVQASTIAANSGADVVASSHPLGGVVTLHRTIVDGHCEATISHLLVSNRYNLESPGNTCQLLTVWDRADVVNAMLDSLSWNGGPTLTMHPQPFSPAVDTDFFLVTANCPEPDQRGVSRPLDGDNDGDDDCDTGAVEHAPGAIFYDDFECGFFTVWSFVIP